MRRKCVISLFENSIIVSAGANIQPQAKKFVLTWRRFPIDLELDYKIKSKAAD